MGDRLDGRARQPAVGAVDELEREVREPVLAPVGGEAFGVILIDDEVHGAELVGTQRASELHRSGDGDVEAVDEHHDDEPAPHRRRDRLRNVVLQRRVLALVLLRASRTRNTTMTGTSTMMTHAPCVNLVTDDDRRRRQQTAPRRCR